MKCKCGNKATKEGLTKTNGYLWFCDKCYNLFMRKKLK